MILSTMNCEFEQYIPTMNLFILERKIKNFVQSV